MITNLYHLKNLQMRPELIKMLRPRGDKQLPLIILIDDQIHLLGVLSIFYLKTSD